jgi:predicted acetyltransferase
LSAVLGRLAQFAPRAVDLTVNLPSDVTLDPRVADPYTIERRSFAGFMVRVIDAEAALKATRFPGSGSIVVKVIDDRLDWNSGRFRIEWTDGWTEASRTSQEPALALDVRTLAQLLVGYLGGADAVDHNLADTSLSRERLAAIFPRKALYQNDHF